MKSTLSLTIFLGLLLTTSISFQIKSDPSNVLNINNQQEYAQFINALLGYNLDQVSSNVKQLIQAHKISLLNAADKVTIILKGNTQQPSSEFKISQQFLNSLGFNAKNINIQNMMDKTEDEIQQITSNPNQNEKVHIIEGDSEALAKFEKLMNQHKKRLLEEEAESSEESTHTTNTEGDATTTDKKPTPTNKTANVSQSYITKFFFIIMFIIVSLGTLGAIAAMDNGKDTLLYAKFIADIGR